MATPPDIPPGEAIPGAAKTCLPCSSEAQTSASCALQCVSCIRPARPLAVDLKRMLRFSWLFGVRVLRKCRTFHAKRGGCGRRQARRKGLTRSCRTKLRQSCPHVASRGGCESCNRRHRVVAARILGRPRLQSGRNPGAACVQARARPRGSGSCQGGRPSASHSGMAAVSASRNTATGGPLPRRSCPALCLDTCSAHRRGVPAPGPRCVAFCVHTPVQPQGDCVWVLFPPAPEPCASR